MKLILAAVAALVMAASVPAMANERGENFGADVNPPQAQPRKYTKEELNKFKLPFAVNQFYLGS